MGTWALEDAHIPMTRYSKSLVSLMHEQVKRVAEEGINVMIDASPYDTGHLVNNWHFSIGAPSYAEHGTYHKGGVPYPYPGRVTLSGYEGGDVWINNNVSYIGYVNDGSANNAPHNMLQKGIAAMRSRAKSIRIIKQQ